ncbi:unnamed protein product [Trifolium pratense]|uniref:Uncharacterized protein n=1 Tax=Trifolium pratense TaxID=57577 RepID=A0ACB0M455_TRIPR|nr:unnamed protein product [Trifolium pratense]
MEKTTGFLVLVLLVAAILSGYIVEGVGRGNQLEKDGPVYKSQKATRRLLSIQCVLLGDLCARDPETCPEYYRLCPPNKDLQTTAAKVDNPKAKNLP